MRAWKVFRWELFKLAKRKASYIGFGLCALFCAIVMFGFAYSDWKGMRRHSGELLDPTTYINGYFYANFCINIAFFSLLPLLAAVIPGSQIAGEASSGTLRALLVRPPSRFTYFGAKALASYLWVQLMVFFLIGFALLLGLIVLGGGEFMIYVWEFREFGPWFAGDWDWIGIFLASGLGAGVSLYMIGSFAMMLSSFTDNPVVAHVGTLGIFFISSIIARMPDRVIHPGFKELMPTEHMTYWHELQHLWHPDPTRFDGVRFWTDFAWCSGYTALFLLIGLAVFVRRDITS